MFDINMTFQRLTYLLNILTYSDHISRELQYIKLTTFAPQLLTEFRTSIEAKKNNKSKLLLIKLNMV